MLYSIKKSAWSMLTSLFVNSLPMGVKNTPKEDVVVVIR